VAGLPGHGWPARRRDAPGAGGRRGDGRVSADLGLTNEQRRFAVEVARAFDRPDVRREVDRVDATPLAAEPDPRPVYRQLGRLGLLAPGWPAELGGRGLGPIETALVVDEMVRRGVPETLHTLSVQIVGQLLLLAGSPEQQRTLLPALAAGERFATVLYSEAE